MRNTTGVLMRPYKHGFGTIEIGEPGCGVARNAAHRNLFAVLVRIVIIVVIIVVVIVIITMLSMPLSRRRGMIMVVPAPFSTTRRMIIVVVIGLVLSE